MSKVVFPDLNADSLTVTVADNTVTLNVLWNGEVTMRDPNKLLEPYLTELANQAAANSRNVILDFSAMTFMNSASLVPVLGALRMLREKEVPTRVYYSKAASWQRVSYSCMLVLAKKLGGITIEYIK